MYCQRGWAAQPRGSSCRPSAAGEQHVHRRELLRVSMHRTGAAVQRSTNQRVRASRSACDAQHVTENGQHCRPWITWADHG